MLDVLAVELERVHAQSAGRFVRSEPCARVGEYVSSLVGGTTVTVAEPRGCPTRTLRGFGCTAPPSRCAGACMDLAARAAIRGGHRRRRRYVEVGRSGSCTGGRPER